MVQSPNLRIRVKVSELGFRDWSLGIRVRIWGLEAAPRRARIQGSKTFVSINSRLESNQERKKIKGVLSSAVIEACLEHKFRD